MQRQISYWAEGPQGQAAHITETIEDSPATLQLPQNQVYFNNSPYMGQSPPQAMHRPPKQNPLPWIGGAALVLLVYVGWSASDELGTMKQQNLILNQQVMRLEAENRALKEMAAIVGR